VAIIILGVNGREYSRIEGRNYGDFFDVERKEFFKRQNRRFIIPKIIENESITPHP